MSGTILRPLHIFTLLIFTFLILQVLYYHSPFIVEDTDSEKATAEGYTASKWQGRFLKPAHSRVSMYSCMYVAPSIISNLDIK